MRSHSRWAVAAVTAALVFALASPASARIPRRVHGNTHPMTGPTASPQASQTPPAPPTAPATASGIHRSEGSAASQPAVADVGKGGLSTAPIDPQDVEAILGKSVRSSAGEDMGRLVDVVVDREGRPRAALIDFGGFLGVGSRKIAVDWGVLKFAHDKAKGDLITVELTRDQVKAAPEFKEGSKLVVLGPAGTLAATPPPKPQAEDTPQAQDKPQTQEK